MVIVAVLLVPAFWIVALFLNVVLLAVLISHQDISRTEKAVLINVCTGDILYLINLPIQVVVSEILIPSRIGCQIYAFFRSWVNGLNSYSIVTLSIRRYIGVTRIHNRLPSDRRDLQGTMKLLVSVWTVATAIAVPDVVWPLVDNHRWCIGNAPYRLFAHGVIPSVVIAVMYILTAIKLRKSIQEMPGENSEALQRLKASRRRSGRTLLALSVVFFLTYVPSLLITFCTWDVSQENQEIVVYIVIIIYILSVFNPLLNPIAMCLMSKKFRRHYCRYGLCCCCCDCATQNHRKSNQGVTSGTAETECSARDVDNKEATQL